MITLVTPDLVVSVSPRRGGKITSLVHRASGREWLEDAEGALEGPPDVSLGFDGGDMCGWDEMLPTIESCEVDGVGLADHGELWRRPWEVLRAESDAASLRVRDDGSGLELTRTLTLERARLRVDYHLVNAAASERAVLWAAHPLFRARPGTRLSLEGEIVEVSEDGRVVGHGAWPGPVRSVGDLAEGECAKYFVRVPGSTPVASLLDPEGTWLSLTWAAVDAPYLGVWLDRAALARHPVIALEPTNGAHDSLAVARGAKGAPTPWVLSAGAERLWTLVVEVGRSHSVPTRSRG